MNLTPSELSLLFTLNNIIAFAVIYIFDVILIYVDICLAYMTYAYTCVHMFNRF